MRTMPVRKTACLLVFFSSMLVTGTLGATQPVETPLPDLSPIRLELLPSDAHPGTPAQIRATIANQGIGDASSFFVLIRVNSQIQSSRTITELKAGAETQIQIPWVVAAGPQQIRVDVDTPDRVAESNEQNNTLTLDFIFGADLAFTNLTLTPEFPKPGQETRITATVRNLGVQDVSNNFAVRVTVGRITIATRFIAGLKSGEERTAEGTWRAAEGEQVIRVSADAFETISEANEANNTLTRIVDISSVAPTGADLLVQDLQIDPPTPQPGQTAILHATVVNQGQGTATGFTVSFHVDGQLIAALSVSELSAAGILQLEASWKGEEGARVIRVKADSTGRIPELEEENNAAALTVDLGPQLNRCGQFAFVQIRDAAFAPLEALSGLSLEEVKDLFLPQLKRVMEEQYQGLNVRFALVRPVRSFATILFGSEDRGNILGEAPLGLRFGTARVYLGSFLGERRLLSLPVNQVVIALATVASHELGHLFGLNHTAQTGPDIMAANAELSIAGLAAPPHFAPTSLQQLQRLLPLSCP